VLKVVVLLLRKLMQLSKKHGRRFDGGTRR